MASSRSRSSASTARSASLTGELWPLIQLLICPRNVLSARAPPSRTAAARRSRTAVRSMAGSSAGNGQTFQAHGRRIGAEAEVEIIGGRELAEHVDQIAGDGDLADGVAALAVLDPEAGGAAAVVAGHPIDAHADEIGDVEALGDVGDQGVWRHVAGGEVQVARP